MGLIELVFKKRGIKNMQDLDANEQKVAEEWQSILGKGDTTIDDIKTFCENQRKVIESQWGNLDNSERKNEKLIIFHTIYSTLLKLISAPRVEKETLERYLRDQLKT